MSLARLFKITPIDISTRPDIVHELVDNIIDYIEDIQTTCSDKPLFDNEEKQEMKEGFAKLTFPQKLFMGAYGTYALIQNKMQESERRQTSKNDFKIAIASINAQPQFFNDYCRKRILKQLNDSQFDHIKVRNIFKKAAGEPFMALLDRPLQPEVEVKPLSLHEQLIAYIDKNYKKDGGINEGDKNGFTRLSWAAYHGDLDMVRRFLAEEKANPNIADHYRGTALLRAGEKGHFDVCRELIRFGADHLIRVEREFSSSSFLSQAMKGGEMDIVKSILDDPKFDINSPLARDFLILTIESNQMDYFMLLLNKGFDVNFTRTSSKTPLMVAAEVDNLPMLQALIQKGAILETAIAWSKTAYDYAQKNKSLSAIKILLEPIFTDAKYESRDMIDPSRILKDLLSIEIKPISDREAADRYTLLKLFYKHQQKVKESRSDFSVLSEQEFHILQEHIQLISKNNKIICDTVDSSLELRLPDAILNIIDEYGHPHAHLESRLRMR